MNIAIVDTKFDEMKKTFVMIPHEQALVVGALAVERLWQPFRTGILDCSYYECEREDVVQLEEKCLDLIWARMQRGSVQESDWTEFCELFDEIEELSAEVDLNIQAKSFYCAIADFAYWCLKACENEKVASIAVCVLELLVQLIAEPVDAATEVPAIVAEMQRIDSDVTLAQGYPQNIDLIIQRKSQYHSLNICLNCP